MYLDQQQWVRLAVVGSALRDFWDDVVDVCSASGLAAEELLGQLANERGREGVAQFLLALPTFGLLRTPHPPPQESATAMGEQRPFDLLSLSVAAVAYDVVVTERQWAHRLQYLKRHRRSAATQRPRCPRH